MLVTSAEYHNAVVNTEFDYVRYVDAFQAYMGLTTPASIPGYLFEPMGKFMTGSTLGVLTGN